MCVSACAFLRVMRSGAGHEGKGVWARWSVHLERVCAITGEHDRARRSIAVCVCRVRLQAWTRALRAW